jgi:hypothetical protein
MELLSRIPRCEQKSVDKFSHKCSSDNLCSQAQHVGVIVLDALVRRIYVMCEGGPDALDLVGSHAGTDTSAANKDPALGLSLEDPLTELNCDIGEVYGVLAHGPNVVNAVPGARKPVKDRLLGRETGVVGTDHEVHQHEGT